MNMRHFVHLLSRTLVIVAAGLACQVAASAEQRVNPWSYQGSTSPYEGKRPWANIPPGQQREVRQNYRPEVPYGQPNYHQQSPYGQPYSSPSMDYYGYSGSPYFSPYSGNLNPYNPYGFPDYGGGLGPYPGFQGGVYPNAIDPYTESY